MHIHDLYTYDNFQRTNHRRPSQTCCIPGACGRRTASGGRDAFLCCTRGGTAPAGLRPLRGYTCFNTNTNIYYRNYTKYNCYKPSTN